MKRRVHPFQVAFAELAFAGKPNQVVMIQCLSEDDCPYYSSGLP
jgi:hypothetical protein